MRFFTEKKRKSNGDNTPPKQCTTSQRLGLRRVRVTQAMVRARQAKKPKYAQNLRIVLAWT